MSQNTYPLTVIAEGGFEITFDKVLDHNWNHEAGFLEVVTEDEAYIYNLDKVMGLFVTDRKAFLRVRNERVQTVDPEEEAALRPTL